MPKILIAEDEPLLTGAYTVKFTKLGCEVRNVDNGDDVFNILKTFQPDIILLDLIMPKLSGVEVLQKLKEENNKIPVIVTSNLSKEEVMKKCLDLGAKDYLIKSNTSLDELAKKVLSYIDELNG